MKKLLAIPVFIAAFFATSFAVNPVFAQAATSYVKRSGDFMTGNLKFLGGAGICLDGSACSDKITDSSGTATFSGGVSYSGTVTSLNNAFNCGTSGSACAISSTSTSTSPTFSIYTTSLQSGAQFLTLRNGGSGSAQDMSFFDNNGAFNGQVQARGGIQVVNLATPTGLALASSATGGTLLHSTQYCYRVTATALSQASVSTAATEVCTTTSTGADTYKITVTWNTVVGADAYTPAGRTTGAELKFPSQSGVENTSFVDDGSQTPSGAITGTAASRIIVPAGGVISDGTVNRVVFNSAGSLDVKGNVSDGASAVGAKIANFNALTTTGAKALQVFSDNNTTEQACVKKLASGWYLEIAYGVDVNAAGALHIGDAVATSVIVGTSTTTTPVQIAGASGGAFKGQVTLSGGSGTATVPSGAICVCADSQAFLACQVSVSSTTATITITGGGSNVVNLICL